MSAIITAIISVISATGILGIGTKSVITRLKHQEHRQKALESGVQALLRDRMIYNYNKCIEQGFAQYHELGGNGVMTRLHAEFMELPTESEEII